MATPGRDRLIAARTAAWTAAERTALAAVVAALRPSARHLTDVLDWLDDIAVRDQVRAGAVLARPELVRALGARGAASDRLKRWKAQLRRLRYPRLVAREQEAAALVRALGLGSDVTVHMPAALEGGTVRVAITAGSATELAAALRRLEARVADGTIDQIFTLLG